MEQVTVGIGIGTTSGRAVAADDDGNVMARARIPPRLVVPNPGRFEHDLQEAAGGRYRRFREGADR